ncbi:MAG: translation initiation factor IF-1A [Candidatus Woesearchaeota archaeon]|jgi:translation initiation factor 1A|nr:translation initiation factor IF-1A [Candidatus Woesearchaeota archaeon]
MNPKKKKLADLENQESTKVKFPRGKQFIGLVEKRLGGSRMKIRSADGRDILARVPGRAKKYLWIREGDIVLLEPWELDENKADLFYKYKPNEVKALEKKGLIADFGNVEEF